ncbi:MAG: hypothetical protein PWP48_1540 [Clostridiales bacterium]|nr:hypothetical protein [Clostridiales bacterium]
MAKKQYVSPSTVRLSGMENRIDPLIPEIMH